MNRLEVTPACPACGGAFVRKLNFKFIAIWALPALVLTMFLERFLGPLSLAPSLALLLMLGYELKAPTAVAATPAGPKEEASQ